MTQPTHTHRQHGGRFAWVGEQQGGGALEGQTLACYLDLDKQVKSVTTAEDWRQHWQEIAPDDCTICLGSGTDQIKGNKRQPCGGCFGLGKVRQDGETPTSEWEVADVAMRIIQRQRTELQRLASLEANPEVRALLKRQHDAAVAESEHKWRDGRGRGPGGRRQTGD